MNKFVTITIASFLADVVALEMHENWGGFHNFTENNVNFWIE